MPVYVDDMEAAYGRMKMCHMVATTDEELHAMADRIGVARKWHQAPPKHDSHYDIALSKRALAIAAGAILITWRECGMLNMQRRLSGAMSTPDEAKNFIRQHYLAKKKDGLSIGEQQTEIC